MTYIAKKVHSITVEARHVVRGFVGFLEQNEIARHNILQRGSSVKIPHEASIRIEGDEAILTWEETA
ncbi:MAG: hypothetical protein GY718_16020 [Lentisphaerae bacterium]|nr:hypothetical protein [Lentisphaerota bacterium]